MSPWGGPGGNRHWSFKAKVAITEIIISHGIVVDSVSFMSIDENGKIEHSEKFGGGGGKTERVLLDWPGEYLTSKSGTCNIFYGNYVVQSLCFYTNQTRYRPFGYTSGSPIDMFQYSLFILYRNLLTIGRILLRKSYGVAMEDRNGTISQMMGLQR